MDPVKSLIYVTSNELKFKVAQQSLQNSSILLEQKSLDTPEIQSTRVDEIAEWSAIWACQHLNLPVVVSDVGYFIEALNGFPGPFIKYVNDWFTADDYLNLMQGKSNRQATIQDCLAYCRPNDKPVVFCQIHRGEIATKAGRKEGTSINQVFIPEGFFKPISEIPPKQMVAHWSTAGIWQKLRLHIENISHDG